MILMRENPLQGPLEGVGPENWDIFKFWNGNEQRHFKARKSLNHSNGPFNGFSCIKRGEGVVGDTKCIYFIPLKPFPPAPNCTECIGTNNLEINSDM